MESTAENHETKRHIFLFGSSNICLWLAGVVCRFVARIVWHCKHICKYYNNGNGVWLGSLLFILCSCEYHVSAAEARSVRFEMKLENMQRRDSNSSSTARLSRRTNNGKIIPCSNKCAIENSRLFFHSFLVNTNEISNLYFSLSLCLYLACFTQTRYIFYFFWKVWPFGISM